MKTGQKVRIVMTIKYKEIKQKWDGRQKSEIKAELGMSIHCLIFHTLI